MSTNKKSLMAGISFGFTSGVITTLGLILGLNASTSSRLAIMGGILTIAFADALSDALGIHVSQESQGVIKNRNLWIAASMTFLTKLLSALTFIVPFVFLSTPTAVGVSIIWGLVLITFFSIELSRQTNEKAWDVIKEHVTISVVVIIVSNAIGTWIKSHFG